MAGGILRNVATTRNNLALKQANTQRNALALGGNLRYLWGMSKTTKPNAPSVGNPSPDTLKGIHTFIASCENVVNGKVFTVNAPNGITVNGTRYAQGDSAPIMNAKLFGWAIPFSAIQDMVTGIAAYIMANESVANALTDSASSVTRGYRHEDRVAVIRAIVLDGKPVTSEQLVSMVESAKQARTNNGAVVTTYSVETLAERIAKLSML